MATVSQAVQAMVDKLHAAMTSGTPLTPEEQLLVAKALSALQDNQTWEKALVAVAEEHLTTATDALTLARTLLGTTMDNSVQAVTDAKDELVANAALLATASQVPSILTQRLNAPDMLFGDMSKVLSQVPGVYPYAPSTVLSSFSNKMQFIFCSDGEVRLMESAAATTAIASTDDRYKFRFYRKLAGAGAEGAFSLTNTCDSAQDAVRSNNTIAQAHYPCFAVLPIAPQGGGTPVFRELISDYSTTTVSQANFRGVGFYKDAAYGFATIGKYNNCPIVDKYGRRARPYNNNVPFDGGYPGTGDHCVLYDNARNCVVVIQDLKVWELYAAGWIDPGIPTFASVAAAQAWLNVQTEMFWVPMLAASYDYYFIGSLLSSYRVMNEQTWVGSNWTDDSTSFAEEYPSVSNAAYAFSNSPYRYRNNMVSVAHTDTPSLSNGYYGWSRSIAYLYDTVTKKLTPTFVEELTQPLPRVPFQGTGTTALSLPGISLRSFRQANLATKEQMADAQLYAVYSNVTMSEQGIQKASIPVYNPYEQQWYERVVSRSEGVTSAAIRILRPLHKLMSKYLGGYRG